ncbi:MAG: hypothetical protein RR475_02545 [Clostridia bacterium]
MKKQLTKKEKLVIEEYTEEAFGTAIGILMEDENRAKSIFAAMEKDQTAVLTCMLYKIEAISGIDFATICNYKSALN